MSVTTQVLGTERLALRTQQGADLVQGKGQVD